MLSFGVLEGTSYLRYLNNNGHSEIAMLLSKGYCQKFIDSVISGQFKEAF